MTTCSETVFKERGFSYRCHNNAKYGDKCGVHSPEAVARRKAKSNEAYKKQSRIWDARVKREREDAHKLATYDALLQTMERIDANCTAQKEARSELIVRDYTRIIAELAHTALDDAKA
jgi:hypothetical protein